VGTASFSVGSRGEKPRSKRPGKVLFKSSVYLEVKVDHAVVEVGCKFATNVTSRQHERSKFFWQATCNMDLGDGSGEQEHTGRSRDFEYVARQLKGTKLKKSGTKKAKTGQPRKTRDSDLDVSDSHDSDADADVEYPPVPRRHSTRKRTTTSIYKEMDHAEGDNQGGDENYQASEPEAGSEQEGKVTSRQALRGGSEASDADAAIHALSALSKSQSPRLSPLRSGGLELARDDSGILSLGKLLSSNPSSHEIEIPTGSGPAWNREEEALLMAPTSGGRNLSRTESIDRIFDRHNKRDTSLNRTDSAESVGQSIGKVRGLPVEGNTANQSNLSLSRNNSSWSLGESLGNIFGSLSAGAKVSTILREPAKTEEQ